MKLENVIELLKSLDPVSVFVYGSKAINDDNLSSDYEMGVVFKDDKYVKRATIKQLINDNEYSIFPFKESELMSGEIDTPFQKNIFLNCLANGGAKTIYGLELVENLKVNNITTDDLLMDTSFNLGYALSSVRVMKENNLDLAREMLYKSMMYATRNLIFCKKKKLVIGYKNIYQEAKKIDLPEEYMKMLDIGIAIRCNNLEEIDPSIYYKNISYINKYVIPSIRLKSRK